MISNKKKALIHVAKQQTGTTDEEYRDLLEGVGVTSSADSKMTTAKFDQVMARFEELGFRTTSKPRRKRKVSNLPKNKQALMKKLEAMLLDLDLPWSYVDSISRSRFGKEAAMWLEGEELYKLVQMMAVYQKRQQKKKRA